MTREFKNKVREQFGRAAEGYIHDKGFATGDDLEEMVVVAAAGIGLVADHEACLLVMGPGRHPARHHVEGNGGGTHIDRVEPGALEDVPSFMWGHGWKVLHLFDLEWL